MLLACHRRGLPCTSSTWMMALHHFQSGHVQVINEVDKVRVESDGVPTEARLTQGLTHPSIVQMHSYKLLQNSRRDSLDGRRRPGTAPPKGDELWLILDFCDKGSVQVQCRLSLCAVERTGSVTDTVSCCMVPCHCWLGWESGRR